VAPSQLMGADPMSSTPTLRSNRTFDADAQRRSFASLRPFLEHLVASAKCEELFGKKFETEQQLRSTPRSYIRFYDRQLHSSLRYLPPAVYESRMEGASSVN
jgi:hypothetical protein